ncbi:MAG: hypothetical protein H0U75_09100 [Legionella sp.]|nr:hypothetical protein [Legionella sp.]
MPDQQVLRKNLLMLGLHHTHTLIIWFLFIYTGFMISSTAAFSQQLPALATCISDPRLQIIRSKELHTMYLADQKERVGFGTDMSRKEINQLIEQDLKRRKRVGEIMGEGCISTMEDYAAAALIYQHGDVPDHYYQAFIWASKALSLGDLKQKALVAMTIDRYLISIGKKQLFGSQFQASSTSGWCTCLLPVEQSFPDSLRMDYLEKKLSEQFKFLLTLNKDKKNCPSNECDIKLSPSLKGSVPGFW